MNKLKYIAAVLIAIAGLGLQQANAFTSTLNVHDSGLNGFTGPFGTVTVTLIDPTHASITWTNNTVNGNTYLFGDGGSVAANISSSFTVTSITGTGPNSAPSLTQQTTGSFNENGFGTMNLKITDFDGFSFAASSVTVTLTNTSGTWASAASVLAFNSSGFDAGAHIFVTTNGGTVNTSITGFAAENAGGVPDGGTTVMLLGAALGALGMARRFLMG